MTHKNEATVSYNVATVPLLIDFPNFYFRIISKFAIVITKDQSCAFQLVSFCWTVIR